MDTIPTLLCGYYSDCSASGGYYSDSPLGILIQLSCMWCILFGLFLVDRVFPDWILKMNFLVIRGLQTICWSVVSCHMNCLLLTSKHCWLLYSREFLYLSLLLWAEHVHAQLLSPVVHESITRTVATHFKTKWRCNESPPDLVKTVNMFVNGSVLDCSLKYDFHQQNNTEWY